MCGVAVGCSWYDWPAIVAIVAIIATRWEPLQYRYFAIYIYNHLPSYTIPWASKPIKIQGCTLIPEVSCKILGIFLPKIWVGVKYWFSTDKVLVENPNPEVSPWNPGCSSACGHTRGYLGTRGILQVLGDYSGNKLVNIRCMGHVHWMKILQWSGKVSESHSHLADLAVILESYVVNEVNFRYMVDAKTANNNHFPR